MNLQVLVATMGQTDLSLVQKMNIRCDAVIANQSNSEHTITENSGFGKVKMITTATKGVGLNRNIALLYAESEILLFADDDMVYNDDMPQAVISAFKNNPKADIIIFGIDIAKNGEVFDKRHLKNKKLHFWNSMRYGACFIAARRRTLLKNNITFHQSFGGGCIYSAGEDNIFLKECFSKGLRVYSNPYVLGVNNRDVSSWFSGYGEKYFYDKGALTRCMFPCAFPIMGLYFAVRFKRQTEISLLNRIKLVYSGINGFKNSKPYKEI